MGHRRRWGLLGLTVAAVLAVAPTARAAASADVPSFTAIAAGSGHTCGLTVAGDVLCWGDNSSGQLGDGTQTTRLSPVPVLGLHVVSAIAAGGAHTCALAGDGVWCWGENAHGQLGDGTKVASARPVRVARSERFRALALGFGHSCALDVRASVFCWGYNGDGQLGSGNNTDSPRPVAVRGLHGATAITAGAQHTCAVLRTGTASCWGYNHHGELGNGGFTSATRPVAVVGLSGPVALLVAGGFHTCATTDAAGVQCWGFNRNYQLGHGTTAGNQSAAPLAVIGVDDHVVAIAANTLHSCVLTATDRTAYCWGINEKGQLGTGTTDNMPTAVPVQHLAGGLRALAAGQFHTCAVDADGHALCWGRNANGELGDGTGVDSVTPVTVGGAASTTARRPTQSRA